MSKPRGALQENLSDADTQAERVEKGTRFKRKQKAGEAMLVSVKTEFKD